MVSKVNDYTQYGTDVLKAVYHNTGKVVIYYRDGSKFIGTDEDFGDPVGYGYKVNKKGVKIKEGMWVDDQLEGDGILYNRGIITYKGEFSKDKKHGNGIEYRSDGITKTFEGVFNKNRRDNGRTYFKNGSYYDSDYDSLGIYPVGIINVYRTDGSLKKSIDIQTNGMLGDFYKEYFNDGITLKEEKKGRFFIQYNKDKTIYFKDEHDDQYLDNEKLKLCDRSKPMPVLIHT